MYLIIDIGNTLHKAAVFSETGKLVELQKFRQLTPKRIDQLFAQYVISHAILSAVGKYSPLVENSIRQHCPLLVLSSKTSLPFSIRYRTPGSLGPDRIANAAGAYRMYPGQNVLSIQSGTCLVCDFINNKKEYLGGSIAPGIGMRFKALKHYTKKLPEVEKRQAEKLVGATTEESILSGVMNGIRFEIEGTITAYQQQYGEVKILLTGGDADPLQKSIKFPIFAAPNNVLWGLYEILRYNVQK